MCQSADDGDKMLICGDGTKGCDMGYPLSASTQTPYTLHFLNHAQTDSYTLRYHIFCLDPLLSRVPDDDWFCHECRGNNDDEEHDNADAEAIKEEEEGDDGYVSEASTVAMADTDAAASHSAVVKAKNTKPIPVIIDLIKSACGMDLNSPMHEVVAYGVSQVGLADAGDMTLGDKAIHVAKQLNLAIAEEESD